MPSDDEENPDTPPGGGRKVKPMTEHQLIDVGDLTRRTADKVMAMNRDWPRVMEMVKTNERMMPVIELAMRPIPRTKYERIALPVIAAVLFAWFVVYTTRSRSISVPEPPAPRAQASR